MATIPSATKEAEASALKSLYTQRTAMSNGAFGEAYGIGTAGMVWQYLNARRPLNLEAATKFARGLKVKIDQFSPRLAQAAVVGQQHTTEPGVVNDTKPHYESGARAWPFTTISRSEIEKLSPDQRSLLESVMRPIVDRALVDEKQTQRAA